MEPLAVAASQIHCDIPSIPAAEMSELRSKESCMSQATRTGIALGMTLLSRDDVEYLVSHESVPEHGQHDTHPTNGFAGAGLGEDLNDSSSKRRDLGFYLVFAALCLTSLLGGLDTTVSTTALSTITNEIGGQDKYVWFANVNTIAMTAVQPLFGQLANIFGRRYMTLLAVGLFILGSGLSGGATNPAMLIGGRAVQGVGSGALLMLQDLIVCDLVPLRERAKFIGIYTASAGVAATLGPLIGGLIAERNWRWIFYLNLPIGGLAFMAVALFLSTKHERSPTWMHALVRIDYVGNTIFIGAVVALLLGIVMGGQSVFSWSSWRVILPLILGCMGLAAFILYETTPACKSPIIPLEIFQNRTSSTALALTFCSGVLLAWAAYFLPIFFQGVQLRTPTQAGVYLIPNNLTLIIMAILAGIFVSITGQYLPLHVASFSLMALAFGLFTRVDQDTKLVELVFLEIIVSTGLAFTMSTPLTALQASLPDALNASSTATFGFVQKLAVTWGITIPAVIFNTDVDNHIGPLNIPTTVKSNLVNGGALGFSTRVYLMSIRDEIVREKIIKLYTHALKMTWYAGMGIALLGLLLCCGERQVELRTSSDNEEFGMVERKRTEHVNQ